VHNAPVSFADSRTEKAMVFRPVAATLVAAALLACARSSEPRTGTTASQSAPAAGAPSSADPLPPHAGPWARGEGTRRMAERLRRLNEAAQPGVNPFLNAERAAQIAQALPHIPDPLERMKATTHRADELLRAGRIEEAIDTVTPLLTPSPADAPYAPPLDETREFIGLCYLRLGETENCILSHNLDSCRSAAAACTPGRKARAAPWSTSRRCCATGPTTWARSGCTTWRR
jgi:hypothetical protein